MVIVRHYKLYSGFNYGFYALDFLFVVSGYLIGQILLKELLRPKAEDLSLASVKKFMIRRWFRILPLYYTALLVRYVLSPDIGLNIFYYVFFLQNHFYGITFFPESWTLVIDEWFYLSVPFLLYFFLKFASRKRLNLLLYMIGIVVSINVARFLFVYYTDRPFAGLVGNVPLRQDTLLIGVIAALIKIQFPEIFSKLNTKRTFWIALGFVVAFVAVMYQVREPVDRVNQFLWTRTVGFSIISVFVAFTLPYTECSIKAIRAPAFKWLNPLIIWGSKLSYAMYLFHAEVHHQLNRFGIPGFYPKFFIAILATLLVSYIMYNLVEKQFLILREKRFS
jgi:peptidoglycan/LPS O-acetylase OafA/YrhL